MNHFGPFAAAAFGLHGLNGVWVDAPWWRPWLVGTATLSLMVTGMDWDVAYVGAVIDAVIIGGVVISARM